MTPNEAINGFCWAASSMNLHQFCEVLGWEEDEYAMGKFIDMQSAARNLGRFDNHTIDVLVRAGLERGR